MKYVKPLVAASLTVGTLGAAVAIQTSATEPANAASFFKAVVAPATTFQCSTGCSLPGVINVDPQGIAGPDATDPTLRIGRWARTIYISCRLNTTGDGTKYLTYVDDREWTGQWWVTKTSSQSPAPGAINDQPIPRCPDHG